MSDRTPADVIYDQLAEWDLPALQVRDDILAALAAAGFWADDNTRAEVARIVATYWRDAIMQNEVDLRLKWAAHPLAMVLAALDGETDPAQLGIDPGSPAAALLDGQPK